MKITNVIKYATIGALAAVIGCSEKTEQPVQNSPLEKTVKTVKTAEPTDNWLAEWRQASDKRLMSHYGMSLNHKEDFMGDTFSFGDYKTGRSGVETTQFLITHELGKRGLEKVEDLPEAERNGFLNSIGKRMDANGDMLVTSKEGHAVTNPIYDALNKNGE